MPAKFGIQNFNIRWTQPVIQLQHLEWKYRIGSDQIKFHWCSRHRLTVLMNKMIENINCNLFDINLLWLHECSFQKIASISLVLFCPLTEKMISDEAQSTQASASVTSIATRDLWLWCVNDWNSCRCVCSWREGVKMCVCVCGWGSFCLLIDMLCS